MVQVIYLYLLPPVHLPVCLFDNVNVINMQVIERISNVFSFITKLATVYFILSGPIQLSGFCLTISCMHMTIRKNVPKKLSPLPPPPVHFLETRNITDWSYLPKGWGEFISKEMFNNMELSTLIVQFQTHFHA